MLKCENQYCSYSYNHPGDCNQALLDQALPMEKQNVFDDRVVTNPIEESLSVLAQASEAAPAIVDGLTKEDFDRSAEAFRNLSRQIMGAFLTLEQCCEAAAQLCVDFAEAYSTNTTTNEGNDSNG